DARSDIHAVGVVLYEVLSGVRPFRGVGTSIFAEILELRPPRLDQVAPHVPTALAQIVERALAKDPAGRFARAEDMRAALAPFASTRAAPPTHLGGFGHSPGGQHLSGTTSSISSWPSVAPTLDGAAP